MDDVVVVGGRCAGAPTAMLLARAGLKVRLIERSERLGDVVSGHMVKVAGAARLRAWGLLDDVLATGCPPMRMVTLWAGDARFDTPRSQEPLPPYLAPRRTVLDAVLLQAAADAGAAIEMGNSVTGLLRAGDGDGDPANDADRVVGVQTTKGERRARLVVGADGRRSRVAELVGATPYFDEPPVTFAYYTYWKGTAVAGLHAYLDTGLFVGVFPTNDDNVLAFVQSPRAGFATAKRDPMAYYLTVLQSRPQVWDLLSPGVMSERLRGMSDLPNFLRTSAGRGWVLAGDAGHHKDPVIARGIADAFRDAELIAAATQRGWDGDLDAALADYPRERDACARPLSDANISLARLDRSGQELGESFFAMSALEAELDAPVSAASPVTS